jgi:cyclase
VMNGRTVKGVNFLNLRDAGDPVELAARYALEGADELVFLDITATHERRKTLAELASEVAQAINIPFTVGGGIVSVDDALVLLHSGADKISINSAAVRRPELISELAAQFGSQCVVLAVDARQTENGWEVYLNGGRIPTGIELFAWIGEAVDRGAGEILFTSMDHDGTRNGFANEALSEMSQRFPVPLIASGGAGNMEHFADAFLKGKADAALAAGIFHYQEVAIPDLKQFLFNKKIPVRIS